MTSVPLEAGVVEYTPPSLENLPCPPVFLLRTPDRRTKTRYTSLLIEENLRLFDKTKIRAEILRGLEALWDADTFAGFEPRVRAFWDAADQHEADQATLAVDDRTAFEHPDTTAMNDLVKRVQDAWQPLRAMIAANAAFHQDSPLHLLRLILTGWRGIDVKMARTDGMVTLDTLDALEAKIQSIEMEAKDTADGVEPGLAFTQLCLEGFNMMQLSEGEAKNSASPSKPNSSPSTSKKETKTEAAGSSTASKAPSSETPQS